MKSILLRYFVMAMLLFLPVASSNGSDSPNHSNKTNTVTKEGIVDPTTTKVIHEGKYIFKKCYRDYPGFEVYLADAIEFTVNEGNINAIEFTFKCTQSENGDYHPTELFEHPDDDNYSPHKVEITVEGTNFKINGSDEIFSFSDNGEHIFLHLSKNNRAEYEKILKTKGESLPSDQKKMLTEVLAQNGMTVFIRINDNNSELYKSFSEETAKLFKIDPDKFKDYPNKFIENAYEKISLNSDIIHFYENVVWLYQLDPLLSISRKTGLQCNGDINDSSAILNSLKSLPKYIQDNCAVYGFKDDKNTVLGTKMIVVYPNHVVDCSGFNPNLKVEAY